MADLKGQRIGVPVSRGFDVMVDYNILTSSPELQGLEYLVEQLLRLLGAQHAK